MTEQVTTVGILYPGEMGTSLGAVLRARGCRVITTLTRRGADTRHRAAEAGIEALGTLQEVIRRSSVIFSLVPPAAAEEVADACCVLSDVAPAGAVFVDVNSIGPEQVGAIAQRFARRGWGFVDGAINGLAKNLTTSGTFFLSGARANEIARLFEGAVKVRVLGNRPGQASTMKMLLGGLSKGVCALFLELALLARRREMLPQFIEATSQIYSGIYALIERMLPTYRQHAARRATEMAEVEQTSLASGQEPQVIAAIRQIHQALTAAEVGHDEQAQLKTIESLVEQLVEQQFLSADVSPQGNRNHF